MLAVNKSFVLRDSKFRCSPLITKWKNNVREEDSEGCQTSYTTENELMILQNKSAWCLEVVWVLHKWLASHILRRKQGQLSWRKRPFNAGSDGEKSPQGHRAGHSWSGFKMTHGTCVSTTKWDGCRLLSQKQGGNPLQPSHATGREVGVSPQEECYQECFNYDRFSYNVDHHQVTAGRLSHKQSQLLQQTICTV